MTLHDNTFNRRQLERWTRSDAHHFVRADWRRYVHPGRDDGFPFALYERKYRPDQPRVPAGNPDGGEWTDDGASAEEINLTKVRIASSDTPRLGKRGLLGIGIELAKKFIKAFRTENGLYDLFSNKDGTVAVTNVHDQPIFGVNSTSWVYTSQDRAAANAMRETLAREYPDIFGAGSIGQMPNNAFYHAEATALFRAARANGGDLSGQSLEVFVDSNICNNCDTVLPYIGSKLGNPTVTFVSGDKVVGVIHDGVWISRLLP